MVVGSHSTISFHYVLFGCGEEDGAAPGEEYSLRFWDELVLKKLLNALVPELRAHVIF
jgi:hypothetical protein